MARRQHRDARNELVGLKWPDIDFNRQRLALDRRLIAIGYQVHETRGKTKTARRNIALDPTTLAVLAGWRAPQTAEFAAVGTDNAKQWVFTNGDGSVVHPHAVYQAFIRIVNNAGVRRIRFHDLRHNHRSLLIQAGVPVKVGSERLGHANIAFTIQTYQHLLPSNATRPRDHQRTTHRTRSTGATQAGGTPWEHPQEHHLTRWNNPVRDEGPGR